MLDWQHDLSTAASVEYTQDVKFDKPFLLLTLISGWPVMYFQSLSKLLSSEQNRYLHLAATLQPGPLGLRFPLSTFLKRCVSYVACLYMGCNCHVIPNNEKTSYGLTGL